MTDIFALVDCNNFYASCERLFAPSLGTAPVVVLSNNDGCIIARSEESKKLGIKMGIPVFEVQELIDRHRVQVFSTNYSLYGNMSHRVMQVLASWVPEMEIYSIDEAFLDLSFLDPAALFDFADRLQRNVLKQTGIPVSVGIASTKCLAKAANHLAKKHSTAGGILNLVRNPDLESHLQSMDVGMVWGVGDQYRNFFSRNGIHTALDLKQANPFIIRDQLGVVGHRIVMELNGRACYSLDNNPAQKKEICSSRSFGSPIATYPLLEEATTNYAALVARKLRRQKSLASSVLVFVMTNKYADGPQYVNYRLLHLPEPTQSTGALIHYSRMLLRSLFREGYLYKKSGVLVSDLVPDTGRQLSLMEAVSCESGKDLMEAIDRINDKHGKPLVKFAVQGSEEDWKMRQHNLSPRYTTRWSDLLEVHMDEVHT